MNRTAPLFLFALLAVAAGVALAGTTPEGKAYLEANKLKEGVQVNKSGLQYRVLKEGKEVGDVLSLNIHFMRLGEARGSYV